uniref:Polypeptide N-acetylgalactosaminyltransferase n=1 Tax=Spermophilus dauricus TaxID=99837 RepID=A0A8C9Q8K7_SPEDA
MAAQPQTSNLYMETMIMKTIMIESCLTSQGWEHAESDICPVLTSSFNVLGRIPTHPGLEDGMQLVMKQQENKDHTQKRIEDEKQQNRPPKKLFPNSPLFKQWGDKLSEAQQKEAEDLFQKFGYNAYLSNQLPHNRTLMDTRDFRCVQKSYPSLLPSLGVILIFMDESLSIIQRAITSVISRTPPRLLKEIILVDDFSSNEELKVSLNEKIKLYNQKNPGLLKMIRHSERRGLAQARNTGWAAATAEVVAILDAHIEVNIGWAEPILARIQEDRTVIVSPVFDKICFDTLQLQKYGLAVHGFNWELWCRYDALPHAWIDLNDVTAPVKSPSIMGILAANRLFLGEIGALDGGMLVYGGENVELSLRVRTFPFSLWDNVWQCGGKIEILPCSRVAHLERYHKPYALDLSIFLKRNALRVAEIWMDEYKHMVYLAWNIPLQNSGIDYGDISSRIALRKKLKCKTFDWYLKNVYPLLKPTLNIVGYGRVRMKNSLDKSICLDQGPVPGNTPIMHPCHEFSPQVTSIVFPTTAQRAGPVGCYAIAITLTLPPPTQGRAIINRDTKRCLEIRKHSSGAYMLVLQKCTMQMWEIQYVIRNWDQTNVQ